MGKARIKAFLHFCRDPPHGQQCVLKKLVSIISILERLNFHKQVNIENTFICSFHFFDFFSIENNNIEIFMESLYGHPNDQGFCRLPFRTEYSLCH